MAPPWSMLSVTLFCSVAPAAKKTLMPDCCPCCAHRLQSSLRKKVDMFTQIACTWDHDCLKLWAAQPLSFLRAEL